MLDSLWDAPVTLNPRGAIHGAMASKYRQRLAQSSGVSSSRAFESDIGKKILMKYGWTEGQGLGRLKNGRTECVQGERREDKKGLGIEKRKSEEQWDNWWADCFNSVAKSISVKAESRAESSDSDVGLKPNPRHILGLCDLGCGNAGL